MEQKTQKQPDSATKSSCPGDLLLAAFIEGKLNLRKKEQVMVHLRQCSDCYQVVAESIVLKRDLSDEGIKSAGTDLSFSSHFIPSWIATRRTMAVLAPLAALFILFFLLNREPGWHSEELLIALQNKGEIERINRSILPDTKQQVILGFSEGLSDQKLAFKTGSLVIDLKLCHRAEDIERMRIISQNLIDLLKINKVTASFIKKAEIVKNSMISENVINQIEEYYLDSTFAYFYKLGLFVEAAKAYSLSEHADLPGKDYFVFLLNQPEFQYLPPGVIRRFNEIEKTVGKNNLAEDHQIRYKLFLEIQKLLS